jgi:hypothetical protein
MVMLANMPWQVIAPSKVNVRQCPAGAECLQVHGGNEPDTE